MTPPRARLPRCLRPEILLLVVMPACGLIPEATRAQAPDTSASRYWPQFRGVAGRGIGSGAPPARWNVTDGRTIRWKTAVPGFAHASPIVWGQRVFLSTAVSENESRARTGWLGGSGASAAETKPWKWQVLCLDAGDGKILWTRTAHEGMPRVQRHIKATHANSTPATDGKHVVAFFGSQGLYCYDFSGQLLWKKDLGVIRCGPHDAPDLEWGFASSPIIHDGQVIVQCDGLNTGFWAAFDIRDGRQLRRVERHDVATWSTPTVHVQGGSAQVILNGYRHMGAYDLQSGEALWHLRDGGDVPVPTPFFASGVIVLTNGHGRSPLYFVRPDARGDLTPHDNQEPPAGLQWWHPKAGSYMPTPVAADGILYVGGDNGVLHVADIETGKLLYKQRLSETGGTYSASAVTAGDRVYFMSEDGDVHVIKAGREYELLATNAMHEVCMATPAISEGRLYIRTAKHLYCIIDRAS